METQALIILLVIGLAAGMLSGLIGVGGGVIIVPALVYFMHYTQHQAQGTSLGVLTLPVVALAFMSYYRDGLTSGAPIDVKVVLLIAAGFIGGAYAGGFFAVRIDQQMLRKVFGVILLYTSIKMLGWDVVVLKWFKALLR